MINNILFVIWFFLPAGIANMTPVLAAKIPYLRTLSFPLDCYLTFRQKRIFGGHKTVRGMLSGIFLGTLIVYLQIAIYVHVPFVRTFVTLDYTTISPILLGLLSSVGAFSGDAIRSFLSASEEYPLARAGFHLTRLTISWEESSVLLCIYDSHSCNIFFYFSSGLLCILWRPSSVTI